jgi:UDP-glucose 4-epimerase
MKRKKFPGIFDFINVKSKNPTIIKFLFFPPFMQFGFRMLALLFKAINLPGIGKIHPWVQTNKNKLFVIPVKESLDSTQDITLPYQIVESFIENSSYRVIVDFCACRKTYQCKNHPIDLGCLLMGEDFRRIPTAWVREVTKEEAKAHLQRGIKAGLPCFAGKPRIDNYIFGIPDSGKMFSICFCCDCCCLGNKIINYLPPDKKNVQFSRLEGLKITVDKDKCNGCGICAKKCFTHQITMKDNLPQIPDDCQGCGRCSVYCPNGAISLSFENQEFVQNTIKFLENMIDVRD